MPYATDIEFLLEVAEYRSGHFAGTKTDNLLERNQLKVQLKLLIFLFLVTLNSCLQEKNICMQFKKTSNFLSEKNYKFKGSYVIYKNEFVPLITFSGEIGYFSEIDSMYHQIVDIDENKLHNLSRIMHRNDLVSSEENKSGVIYRSSEFYKSNLDSNSIFIIFKIKGKVKKIIKKQSILFDWCSNVKKERNRFLISDNCMKAYFPDKIKKVRKVDIHELPKSFRKTNTTEIEVLFDY